MVQRTAQRVPCPCPCLWRQRLSLPLQISEPQNLPPVQVQIKQPDDSLSPPLHAYAVASGSNSVNLHGQAAKSVTCQHGTTRKLWWPFCQRFLLAAAHYSYVGQPAVPTQALLWLTAVGKPCCRPASRCALTAGSGTVKMVVVTFHPAGGVTSCCIATCSHG